MLEYHSNKQITDISLGNKYLIHLFDGCEMDNNITNTEKCQPTSLMNWQEESPHFRLNSKIVFEFDLSVLFCYWNQMAYGNGKWPSGIVVESFKQYCLCICWSFQIDAQSITTVSRTVVAMIVLSPHFPFELSLPLHIVFLWLLFHWLYSIYSWRYIETMTRRRKREKKLMK